MRLKGFDGLAMSLSGLCLIHCLALPVLAVSLPIMGAFAKAQWVHWAFVALAAPVSMLALFGRAPHPSWPLVAMATVALGLLVAGAAGWPDHDWETALTVVGGLVLAGAHAVNWRRKRQPHRKG